MAEAGRDGSGAGGSGGTELASDSAASEGAGEAVSRTTDTTSFLGRTALTSGATIGTSTGAAGRLGVDGRDTAFAAADEVAFFSGITRDVVG